MSYDKNRVIFRHIHSVENDFVYSAEAEQTDTLLEQEKGQFFRMWSAFVSKVAISCL